LKHRCDCVIDWGLEPSKTYVLYKLFPQLAPEPCPVHTEGTITPQPLVLGKIRVRVAELLWYWLATPDKYANARANYDRAIRGNISNPRSSRPRRAY
jgi:hypothetical protein